MTDEAKTDVFEWTVQSVLSCRRLTWKIEMKRRKMIAVAIGYWHSERCWSALFIGKRQFSGHWLWYSRGTQASHTAATCDAASNVTKSTFRTVLWRRATNMFDGVQFISRHDVPAASLRIPNDHFGVDILAEVEF
jgi:hypothetical protein